MQGLSHHGPFRTSGKHRPRWTFEGCSSASRRVHPETRAFGKVGSTEGTHETAPMTLPLRLMTMCQATKMNAQRLTGASPLLQSTLPLSLRSPTTPTATCRMVVMAQNMLPVPHVVCALGARLPRRALGAMAALQPWGRNASEFGYEAIKFVHTDEILLPSAYAQRAVLVQNHSPGVFNMTATAVRGLRVRLLVQKPVHVLDSSRLGLVPCEMCLNPGDINNFVNLRQDTTPQIPALGTGRSSPLEGALKGKTNVLAVGDYMQKRLGALDSLEQSGNLAALSRLGRPHHRAVGRYSIVCGYAPARTWAARRGAAAPIRRDHCDAIGDQVLRVPPEEGLHCKTPGSRVVINRNIACVLQTTWRVGQQGWAPWQLGTVINKMGPICMGRTAHWTVVIFSPTEMCNLRCVDCSAQEDVPEGSMGRIGAWCARP